MSSWYGPRIRAIIIATLLFLLSCVTLTRASTCPKFADVEIPASVKSGFQRDEISGIAISKTQKYNNSDIVFLHNDGSKDTIAAYEVNSGNFIQKFSLKGISTSDLEDMAIGPCVDSPSDCIYLADIGNNKARVKTPFGKKGRKKQQIIKFPEPVVDGSGDVQLSENIKVFTFTYGKGSPTKKADAESILVDPIGDKSGGKAGDIYIITKWSQGQQKYSRIFRYPYTKQSSEKTYAIKALTDAYVKDLPMITRGDISADGSMIAIGTRTTTHFWKRNPSQSISQAIQDKYCGNYSIDRNQHHQLESIGFGPDNAYVLEISECGDLGCNAFPNDGPLIGRRAIEFMSF